MHYIISVEENLINELTNGIIETKDVEYIYKFSKIEGAPMEKLSASLKQLGVSVEKEKMEELKILLDSDRIHEIEEHKEEYKKLFYANEES